MSHNLLCPVCNGSSTLLAVVDFNKSCEEARGKFLSQLGIPVYYVRCSIIFNTFVGCNIHPNQRINWWYAHPRNGHISLYSKQSLVILAQQYKFIFERE